MVGCWDAGVAAGVVVILVVPRFVELGNFGTKVEGRGSGEMMMVFCGLVKRGMSGSF